MSRARRIAQYLYDHPNGVGIAKIRDAVDQEVSFDTIGSQLFQLIEAGKARRTGAGRNALYFPTPLVLTDKRTGKAEKPKTAKSIKPTAPKPQPKPKSMPMPQSIPAAPLRTRSATFARIKPRVVTAGAAPETVEEFLARGGRIQYCKPGECGFVPISYRDQSQAHKDRVRDEAIAKHQAKPRNQIDPDDDVDDLDDAA